MQAAYDEALLRVLADMARTTTVTESIVVDFTEPDLQYSFGTRHRMSLLWYEDVERATAELADRIQDDVLEELWGPVWPECPGHRHPCAAELIDEVAVWACPSTHEIVARVGSL